MYRQLTEEEWRKEFEPGERINNYSSSDLLKAVLQYPDRIWTELGCDGNCSIVSGVHFVNRQGYFISKKAINPTEYIDVLLEEE